MKEEKSILENTSFRYLRGDQITNPHFEIVSFFGCKENIECFRYDILRFIEAACSTDSNTDKADYYLNQQQFIMLIELAFVLKNSKDDFTLADHHPLFRKLKGPFLWDINNMKDLSFPSLNFRGLNGEEVNNVRLFIDDFFTFMSLDNWSLILDHLLLCAHKKTTIDKLYDGITDDIICIPKFMEKLIEAMFLIFKTKSIPYAKLHHSATFDFTDYDG